MLEQNYKLKYYTNVAVVGNNILYRGIKDGRRVKMKIGYAPTLFLPAKKETKFKTLHGEYLDPMRFETIRDARDFVKKYDDVSNFKIYGNTGYQYAFIADEHPKMIDWNIDDLSIAITDIEVGGGKYANKPHKNIKIRKAGDEFEVELQDIGKFIDDSYEIWDEDKNEWVTIKNSCYMENNGFPDPYLANEPITAICITYLKGETVAFGCGDYVTQGSEKYIKCVDEYALCKAFLQYWQENCPDVLTGWNTKFFDIPYLVNRFRKLLGVDETKKLSPWGLINERKVNSNHRELIAYEMVGVASLDYIELYRWYAPAGKSQESYKLDNIANVELGDSKLSYDEYDNLHALYRLNYQKFLEYNIQDVKLILRLDDKLKLIELGLTLAYDTKTNYEDIFTQTRMWDAMTYSYLLEKNIIVPPKVTQSKTSVFEGAYVKDPQIGMHNWVASFDLTSLYPHIMMQYCISPENLVDKSDIDERKRKITEELKLRNTK